MITSWWVSLSLAMKILWGITLAASLIFIIQSIMTFIGADAGDGGIDTDFDTGFDSETADATSAILSMVSDRKENKSEGNMVRERQYLTTMFSSIGSNDLKSLKAYLDTHYDDYKDDVTFIDYRYSIRPIIYTIDAADNVAKLNPSSLQSSMYSSQANSFMSTLSFGGNSVFNEMSENYESFKDQYDVLAGRWPEKYDELLLVLSEPNSISDLLVYSLGLRDTNELRSIINSVMSGEEVSVSNPSTEYSYEQLMGIDLRLIEPSDMYKYNVRYDVYEDMSGDDAYMRDLLKRSLKLNIVGIVCAKDDSSFALSTATKKNRKASTSTRWSASMKI